MGLTETSDSLQAIDQRVGNEVMIVLQQPGETGRVVPRHTGRYRVAIHLPPKKELARVVARLFGLRYPNSPTDHADWTLTVPALTDLGGLAQRLSAANMEFSREDSRLVVDDPFSNTLQIAVS